MGSPSTEDEIDFLGLYPSGGWFCKYPNLVVSGDTITQEQAEEVILRCSYNPVDFGNSDRRKAEFYQGIGLPLVDITDARDDEEEGRIREAVETLRAYFKMRIKKSLRPLQLQYLNFDRITSCHYLGGSGIVDWNTGEWRSTMALTEEQKEIVRADFLEYSDGFNPNRAHDELMLYIKHLNWRLSVAFKTHEDKLGTLPEDVEDFLLEWADED